MERPHASEPFNIIGFITGEWFGNDGNIVVNLLMCFLGLVGFVLFIGIFSVIYGYFVPHNYEDSRL